MEWCKLYATFATDPKVIGLSDKAFRRYVEGMCYTTLHETDGWATWPTDKVTAELRSAGLLDDVGFIHAWTKRQRTAADVDAKRIAGRNAARIRWSNGKPNAKGNAAPNTEVEVEVERDTERAKPKSNTLAPTARVHDPIWDVFVEAYGEPTSSARGQWNKAAKVLRDYPATPDEIRSMIQALAGTDSSWAVITPTALAKHFGQRDVLASQVSLNGHGSRSRQMADELRRQGR